jgi:alpha-beta hydrolase superfamily lysophospholipase
MLKRTRARWLFLTLATAGSLFSAFMSVAAPVSSMEPLGAREGRWSERASKPLAVATGAEEAATAQHSVFMQLIRLPLRSAGESDPDSPGHSSAHEAPLGGHRDVERDTFVVGAYYQPAGRQVYGTGLLIVPDFDEAFHSPRLDSLARAAARAGYPTFSLGLRRQDHGFLSTRWRYAVEGSAEEVEAGFVFLMKQGVQQVIILGSGFGAAEAIQYKVDVWDWLPERERKVTAVWRLGGQPPRRPDPGVEIGLRADEFLSAVSQARELLASGLERAYVSGRRGDEWAIEAGSFVDYFDPAGPGAFYAGLAETHAEWVAGDDDDWVANVLAALESRAPHPRVTLANPLEFLDETRCDTPDVESYFLNMHGEHGITRGVIFHSAVGVEPEVVPNGKAVVLVHGAFTHFHAPLLHAFGRCLSWNGYVSLSINLGEADRAVRMPSFERAMGDIDAAVAYLEASGVAPEGIYIHAHSLGATVATAYAASNNERIRGLILTAPPSDFPRGRSKHLTEEELERALTVARAAIAGGNPERRVIVEYCPKHHAGQWCEPGDYALHHLSAEQVISFLAADSRARPVAEVQQLRIPLLIMRSSADEHGDCEDAHEIFEAASRAESAAIVVFRAEEDENSEVAHALRYWDTDTVAEMRRWMADWELFVDYTRGESDRDFRWRASLSGSVEGTACL